MKKLNLALTGRNLGVTGVGRATREASGLSVRQVASILKVDPGTLSRWERGKALPRLTSAVRWAKVCEELRQTITTSPISVGGVPDSISPQDLVDQISPGDGDRPDPGSNVGIR